MKKRSNKIISFIKNNWYFVLLVIPFVFFCMENKEPDNDIWFLMANGKYVLGHGIPYIDPLSIHEGLNYVMQQWLSAVILYGSYRLFGKFGLLVFLTIIFFVITFIYYKLCMLVTNKNKKLSFLITILIMTLSKAYIVSRPQIFTYIVLLLELMCMEKYIKSKNWKMLIPMPFLSILLINLHASMWLLQFVFMLPVLANCIYIKGITIDKVQLKPMLITIVLMFLGGFLNPYGWNSMIFVFSTYGIPEINVFISEMQTSNMLMFHWRACVCLALSYIALLFIFKKKTDVRFILFFCGMFLFSSMHGKCLIYFILYFGYILGDYLAKIKPIKLNVNPYIKRAFSGLCVGLFFCLIYTAVFTTVALFKNYDMSTNALGDMVRYVKKNYDVDDIILFVSFEDGGYTEFEGIKSYIDPRAELFTKKLNGKEDILKEYVNIGKLESDKDAFIKKYNFTHLIVSRTDQYLYDYLSKDEDYVLEYTEYFDKEKKEVDMIKLFVRKDISILEGENYEKDN